MNLKNKKGIKTILSLLFLAATPAVTLVFTQIVAWMNWKGDTSKIGWKDILIGTYTMMSRRYWMKNLIVCCVLLFFMILIFRKVKAASLVYCMIMIIMTLVNYYVRVFRGQPFMILDVAGMGTAAEVAGGYNFQLPGKMILLLIAVAIFAILQMFVQKLEFGKKGWKNFAVRMIILVVGLILSYRAVPTVEEAGIIYLYNLNWDYAHKGYPYTLFRELVYLHVDKPEGYSVEKAEQIGEETEKEQKEATAGDGQTVVPENIIMIMNESLTDFEKIGDLQTDQEILPFIHSLNKNVKHGSLHVPTYGGLTASTEYEALTGNTIQFMPLGSVPYQLYVREPEYSIVNILKSQGYETIAMHPNKARNWNRKKVYERMGFDQFISEENWGEEYSDIIRKFPSDKCAYDRIIDLCDQKEDGQKLFTFCVTMQNHGNYGEANNGDYEPTVKLNYDQDYPMTETYLSLERESDKAFKELLEHFEKVDEPTMIIMFGDHWPKTESDFLTSILGKEKNSLDLVESQQIYETPYVIWTNYSSETVEADMSANYMGSYILQQAGLEYPAYNKLILDIKEQLPIIGMGAVCDSEGKWYSIDDLPEKYQKLMDAYNILEYNNQFEKKTVLENLFTLP